MKILFPPHIQEYLDRSPHAPFTTEELARLANRIEKDPHAYAHWDAAEFDLLSHRAAVDGTDRSVAILNNAIKDRAKRMGLRQTIAGVICSCGSAWSRYVVDGPDPLQKVCENCGAAVSVEHERKLADAKLAEMGAEIRRKLMD